MPGNGLVAKAASGRIMVLCAPAVTVDTMSWTIAVVRVHTLSPAQTPRLRFLISHINPLRRSEASRPRMGSLKEIPQSP